jgi:hypothetical protein
MAGENAGLAAPLDQGLRLCASLRCTHGQSGRGGAILDTA